MWATVLRKLGQDCQPLRTSLTSGSPAIISFTAASTVSPPPSDLSLDVHSSNGTRNLRDISRAAPAALIKFFSGLTAPNTPMRNVPPPQNERCLTGLPSRKY